MGQLEPNDATAGPLLDGGQAAPFLPLGLAAGESQAVLWLLAAQPRERSADFGGPATRSPSPARCCPALPTQHVPEARWLGPSPVPHTPCALSFNLPRQPSQDGPATLLRTGEEAPPLGCGWEPRRPGLLSETPVSPVRPGCLFSVPPPLGNMKCPMCPERAQSRGPRDQVPSHHAFSPGFSGLPADPCCHVHLIFHVVC